MRVADENGRSLTLPEVLWVALTAHRLVPVVIRRSDDTPMTRLRTQARRAAKALDVAVQISIVTDDHTTGDHTMIVLAHRTVPDDQVRRAMDVPNGI